MYETRDKEGKFTRAMFKQLFSLKTGKLFFVGTLIITFSATALLFGTILPLIQRFSPEWGKIAYVQHANAEFEQSVSLSKGVIREVTMYSSTPEQTDSSPCVGANNQDICVLWRSGQNICATNAFPLGTELKIDKLGDCLVIDRMNKRFSQRIDFYAGYDENCLDGVHKKDICPNYQRAKNFGLQNLLVIVK